MTKEGDSSPQLSIQDISKPSSKKGELLIKIWANSVQPSDILNSKGSFSSTTFPRTPGRDFAGTVVEGPAAWKDRNVYGTSGATFSFTTDGAAAEYAIVPENGVAPMPKNLTFVQAASLGTIWTTACLLLDRTAAQSGQTVMILGATGSVGSTVAQLAESRGCTVLGVGRHNTQINSEQDPELKMAKELTNGKGPDIAIDTVGDLRLTLAAFNVLATNGRLGTITAPRQGNRELSVDILSLYRRQISIVGCNSAGQDQAAMAQLLAKLVPGFESGQLKAPEEKDLNLVELDRAMDAYSGKIKKAVIVMK